MVVGAAVLAFVAVACTADLGTFGGTYGGAADVNDAGTIVGYSAMPDGKLHAFVRQPLGALVDLGTGSRTQSTAHAINDKGVVVGSTADKASGPPIQTPFVWTAAGGLTELALPPGYLSAWAIDINDAGVIAVNAGRPSTDAWVYNSTTGAYAPLPGLGGTFEQAAAIAPDGTVVGTATTSTGVEHAVTWDATTHAITDLDAGKAGSSAATGINAHGVVVGWSNSIGTPEAYRWTAGARTTIGVGRADAINDDGVIVGVGKTATGDDVAHLWHPSANVSYDFAGVASGGSLEATAINSTGTAVGTAGSLAASVPARFDAYTAP